MKAADVGMIKRNVLRFSKTDVIIEVNGVDVTITIYMELKTLRTTLQLGVKQEADLFGFDRMIAHVTTLENDTLVCTEANDPTSVISIKANEDGMIMTMTTKGITGIRTFKRA